MAAENINSDLPLAKACKADVEKLCTTLAAGTTVLACLREKKEELSSECKTEVFDRQAGAADDWRTDTELFKACQVHHFTIKTEQQPLTSTADSSTRSFDGFLLRDRISCKLQHVQSGPEQVCAAVAG